MTILISNEEEYEEALRTIWDNWPDEGAEPTGEFEELFRAVEAYENEHYPMPGPEECGPYTE